MWPQLLRPHERHFYSPTTKTLFLFFSVLFDQPHKRVRWQMLGAQLRVKMKEETIYKWPQFLSLKLISDINPPTPTPTLLLSLCQEFFNFVSLTLLGRCQRSREIDSVWIWKALKCKTLGASSLVNYANARARKLATPRVVAVMRGAVSSHYNKGQRLRFGQGWMLLTIVGQAGYSPVVLQP